VREVMLAKRLCYVAPALMLSFYVCGCTSSARASPPPSPSATSNQPTPDLAAIKAAEDAATKVYLSCVDGAAKRLDDHRSDPATIAQGALSVCGKEFDATVEVFSRNYDNYLAVREKVSTQLRQTSMNFAIQRILINRKATHAR
jgi:hypothetical protein